MTSINRRTFSRSSLFAALGAATPSILPAEEEKKKSKPARSTGMRFGLVTYLWGQHWDLATLLKNCEASRVLGVELRTTHKHGVEPSLNRAQRAEVKKRFADSPAIFVGPGSNENFDNPDAGKLKAAMAATKKFLQLSHDCGGSGVKVKPNSFHKNVPREKTIAQIGASLKELGKFASDLGQEVRLEVHGQCAELPTIRAIMEAADHPNARVCWNSNKQDLLGSGSKIENLKKNFALVQNYFGATAHVREVNIGDYPYAELAALYQGMDYRGWILLEARTKPDNPVEALIEQRTLWEKMVVAAWAKSKK